MHTKREMETTRKQNTATAKTETPIMVSFPTTTPEGETTGGSGLAAKTEMRSKVNNWFMVGVYPSSYGCTWEVAKHERSVRFAQGVSRMRLCVLCS